MNYKEIENKIKEIYENNEDNYHDEMRKFLSSIPLDITISQTYHFTPDDVDLESLYLRICDCGEGFEHAITRTCAMNLDWKDARITGTIRNKLGDVLYNDIIDEEEL